jgi:gamma-glutamyltranspeptidase/glutathione hydrolase
MTAPDFDRFTSRRSTVYGSRGVVATSQPLAAEAGIETLRTGGNAFDAAVATAGALNVVEPTSTGLGGDVIALYRTADSDVGAIRSCGGAPANATIGGIREALADGEQSPSDVKMPKYGPHTVTVPGAARGWEELVQQFGRLDLGDVLQPAIHYAAAGFPVTEKIANFWEHGEDLFQDDHAREAYLVDGERAPNVGEVVRLPQLGESLRLVAEKGADVVYEGDIGRAIVEEIQSKGGFMGMYDLVNFEVEYPDPVSTTYRGATIYELPPNNQGLITLEALNIADEVDAGEAPPGSIERIHRLVEATKLAFHDGHHFIADPDYEEIPPLASREWAVDRAHKINDHDVVSNISMGVPDTNGEDSDTVLVCVADDEGNVVSLINSRFSGFGSGLVAGNTGIALQNRGAAFTLDPDHPNRLKPGKRPFHSLIPAVARFGDDDWAAFGCMGGYMQPQGHVQILSHIIDDDLSIQRALDEPRWRYRAGGTVAVEGRFDGNVASKLVRKGHDVHILTPKMFGGAQIARADGGTLSAATEPRGDGHAAGF